MNFKLYFPKGLYTKLKQDILATNNNVYIENKQSFLYIIDNVYRWYTFTLSNVAKRAADQKEYCELSTRKLSTVIEIKGKLTQKEMVNFLIENGYLQLVKDYSTAGKCRAYDLGEEFKSIEEGDYITVTYKPLIKRMLAYYQSKKKNYTNLMKELDKNISEIVINEYFSKKWSLASLVTPIITSDEDYLTAQTISNPKTSNRMFHALTTLPREIRYAAEHKDGSKLVEIDLSAAHCVWLAKENRESNLYDETFNLAVENGTFYEQMMKFNNLDLTDSYTRTKVKIDFQRLFINAKSFSRSQDNYWIKFLKAKHSNFYKWFCKEYYTKKACNHLTSIESYYFNGVFGQFCSDNDIFWCTVHDCIIVKTQDVECVLDYMKSVLNKDGYKFHCKTKEYDFASIEETSEAILKISKYKTKPNLSEVKPKTKQEVSLEAVREAKKQLGDEYTIRKIMAITGLGINTVQKYLKLI